VSDQPQQEIIVDQSQSDIINEDTADDTDNHGLQVSTPDTDTIGQQSTIIPLPLQNGGCTESEDNLITTPEVSTSAFVPFSLHQSNFSVLQRPRPMSTSSFFIDPDPPDHHRTPIITFSPISSPLTSPVKRSRTGISRSESPLGNRNKRKKGRYGKDRVNAAAFFTFNSSTPSE
jgi:hypothetical protein